MEQHEKQLTLQEKWKIDAEIAGEGNELETSYPQCEDCNNFIKGNVFYCHVFQEKENKRKPGYVVFPKKECPQFDSINPLSIQADEKGIMGGIFGLIAGDALGVPVEFTSRKERKQNPVQEMRAYGTYHQHFGTWSDDTSLTLCLIDSLIRGYDIHNMADKFVGYYKDALWTPHGVVFDIGNATREAIVRMQQGIEPAKCGGRGENDNGNGSLMRILPLTFYIKDKEPLEKIKIIEEVSALTHGHKRSQLACILYVEYAIQLLDKKDKGIAYQEMIAFAKEYCKDDYLMELHHFQRIMDASILQAKEQEVLSTGYVVHSLEAAIWCIHTTDSYQQAVLKAVNLGGDTDTIAAITGGIAGVLYGCDAIPNTWIQSLARKEDIYQLLCDFEKCC